MHGIKGDGENGGPGDDVEKGPEDQQAEIDDQGGRAQQNGPLDPTL
jgi:hypothetical protein